MKKKVYIIYKYKNKYQSMMKSILMLLFVSVIIQFIVSCNSQHQHDMKNITNNDNQETVATKVMIQELIKKVETFPKTKKHIVLLPLNDKETPIAIEVKNKIMIIQLLILQEVEMRNAIAIHDANTKRIVASFMINENSYREKFGETWFATMQKPARRWCNVQIPYVSYGFF